jgi:hypothetical protein
MAVTSLRLAPETLAELRTLAHLESLRRGCSVSWAGLIREVVEQHLLDRDNKHEHSLLIEQHG